MRSERYRSQKPVLGVRVFVQLVAVLDSCEVAESSFELGLQSGVVEQPQRTGVDVIDYALLHPQQERLALVHKNLRDVLVHDDGTLDRVFRQFCQFLVLVKLPGNCLLSSSHFVGLDLSQTVLASHIAAERNEVDKLLLELCGAALLKVLGRHVGYHFQGSCDVLALEHRAHLAAVVALLAHFPGELLDQLGFEGYELVLERQVALLAHVLRDDELLDGVVLGCEVFVADLLQLVQDFVVLGSVLHNRLERLSSSLAEDLALRKPGEGAGH